MDSEHTVVAEDAASVEYEVVVDERHEVWLQSLQRKVDDVASHFPENWKNTAREGVVDLAYELQDIVESRVKKINKDYIAALWNKWEIAGILDEFAKHNMEPGMRYRIAVPFDIHIRKDFVLNRTKVRILNTEFKRLFVSMEEKLNWIYSRVRKADLVQARVPFDVVFPELPCVVLDRSLDFHGRFRRAKVLKMYGKNPESAVVICELVDRGVMQSYHLREIFLMVRKFTEVPPRIVTVQLRDMKRFAGSPKFGMLLHTTLFRYCSDLEMLCEKSADSSVEVTLWYGTLMEPLNNVILRKLCEDDPRNMNDPRNRKQGEICDSVCVSAVRADGRIFIRPVSRVTRAIDDALLEFKENFELYNALFKHQDVIYVGKHPQNGGFLRCQVIGGSTNWESPFLNQVTVNVKWIDRGDEGFVRLNDLVPASIVNQVLVMTKPLAQEVHLNNIKRMNEEKFYSFLPRGRVTTVRIVRDAYESRGTYIRPTEVEILVRIKGFELKPTSLNDHLIQQKFAQPLPNSAKFSRRRYLRPSGLTVIGNKYPCIEWVSERQRRFEREDIAPGHSITFYVAQLGYGTYRIRPWFAREAFNTLKSILNEIHEELPWIKEEMNKEPYSCPPWGQFCVVKKDKQFHRAKVLGEYYEDPYDRPQKCFKVLLIDNAVIDKFPASALWRIFPSVQVLQLGPQAVVAALKDEKMETSLSSPTGAGGGGRLSVGKKYTAVVETISEYDNSGRGLFILKDVKGG